MSALDFYGTLFSVRPTYCNALRNLVSHAKPDIVWSLREVSLTCIGFSNLRGTITEVQGTGLLLCAELDTEKLPVVGFGCVEEWCRINGLGVIHGGHNALRFTPHFAITSEEIDMIVGILRNAILTFTSQTIEAN